MLKSKKEAVVESLADMFSKAEGFYLTNYKGMDVASITELRERLRTASASYRVVKNTLARLALERSGNEMLKDFFDGPVGVVFASGDAILPAKILADFAKETTRPEIRGAYLDARLFTPDEVVALAALPSKDELLTRAVRGVQSPLSGLVGCLSGMLRNAAGVLRAVAEAKEG
ncbi:MAG: 50S ribosomal protein L10 [Candidatus Latescibacteria bacterium 4484_107]|nr:MAG: 50S ribosomal protein L10 [Candidatus Latescibacteria bacterium 4484_107]